MHFLIIGAISGVIYDDAHVEILKYYFALYEVGHKHTTFSATNIYSKILQINQESNYNSSIFTFKKYFSKY
jgi:hypothetical protein